MSKVLGVVKDKWQAATNALKKVFHKLWIGYCHRHCLKKFREALTEYHKETTWKIRTSCQDSRQ
ncbi:hypothetical protein TI05_00175 [Achromatium sp. WMS3]|nr:hypothetical protein TI05_00175 [Achromatium sp. WMS3]